MVLVVVVGGRVLGDLLALLELDVVPLLASLVGLQLLVGVLFTHTQKVGYQPSQKIRSFLVKKSFVLGQERVFLSLGKLLASSLFTKFHDTLAFGGSLQILVTHDRFHLPFYIKRIYLKYDFSRERKIVLSACQRPMQLTNNLFVYLDPRLWDLYHVS